MATESRFVKAFLLTLVVMLVGCGQRGNSEVVPVDGTVSLNGKPLDSGLITFWPEGGRTAKGYIQADGTFILGTYTDTDGAIPGTHKVTITNVSDKLPEMPDFDAPLQQPKPASKPPIPLVYANPSSSGVSYEVKQGEDNHAVFTLSN